MTQNRTMYACEREATALQQLLATVVTNRTFSGKNLSIT